MAPGPGEDDGRPAPPSTDSGGARGAPDDGGFVSVYVTSQDGLRLHARDYRPSPAESVPVVCLPGLTRTAADFHALASALSNDPVRPRRVLALDYRGRGRSDYDPDPGNYAVAAETADVVTVLTACETAPAIFVGTSRGGLIVMALAAARPTFLAGAVLNDIGPVIEHRGLMRIKRYVGALPAPRSFEDGADVLRRLFGDQFTRLAAADWLAMAHRSWKLESQRLVPTYDVRLARALADVQAGRPLPSLWAQFDALAGVPLMVLRGANSDLLSAETVAAMQTRRPDMVALEVPDEGHAPLLTDADLIRSIAAFAAGCDQGGCAISGGAFGDVATRR